MQPEEKKRIKADLKEFDTIGGMFTYLNEKYCLERAKIGTIMKPIFIDSIVKALEMIKPQKR